MVEDCFGPQSRLENDCLSARQRRVSGTLVSNSKPPSSRKAFEFLARFAMLYNLGSQFLVALATTMTFPTHSFHGTMVQLPFLGETKAQQEDIPAKFISPEWITTNEELPYYMALSCNPEVVISRLCGMFWEDNVTCNIVSPWLHPILNEIPDAKDIIDKPNFYHEILAIMCSFRRPRISVL